MNDSLALLGLVIYGALCVYVGFLLGRKHDPRI